MREAYNTVSFCSRGKPNNSVILLTGNFADSERMENQDVVAIRRAKLRELIDTRFGGEQARMCDEINITSGELSSLLRNRNFGEKKARKLEKQLGLDDKYLDGVCLSPLPSPNESLRAKVDWLLNNADPDILTMFELLLNTQYYKRRGPNINRSQ